ncbi:MAG: hypothetical protein K6G52_09060 [Treponemataceae bacterium]|nr:hypothetical protein [Treponemataceae bacterium]
MKNIFLFDKCLCCGRPSGIFQVCPQCQKKYLIPYDFSVEHCKICGKKLISENDVCFECRENAVIQTLDSVYPLFSYKLWKKDLLFKWKMEGRRYFAFYFASKINEVYRQKFSGLPIVPVPPRPFKIYKKGWDQINDLTHILKYFYKIPVCHLLIRTEKNEQKKKNRTERLSNGNTAYCFNQKVFRKKNFSVPKEVVLIDDILTTGVTVENCCEVLKKNGVEKVHAITVFIAD